MFNSSITDAQLLLAVKADDASAFRELFERYWLKLYKYAFKHFGDEHQSKEAVHVIFVNLWERRHKANINSLQTYLITAVRYHYYDQQKLASNKLIFVDTPEHQQVNIPSNDNEAWSRYNHEHIFSMVERKLTSLPKRCQEIFLLSRKNHLTNEEIAQKLNLSKRTVENQLSQALRYIRDHITLADLFCICILPYAPFIKF